MEMEGKGYSELYRNSSEELFIKTMMESSIGVPAPTMEMLGFKNLSQNFRTDSEELFKTWLANCEFSCRFDECLKKILFKENSLASWHTSDNGCNLNGIAHRTREVSRSETLRVSAEISNLSNQQHGGVLRKKRSDDVVFPQSISMAGESSNELNQLSVRNAAERGLQASNLFLAEAWFNSSQPMTRSHSSELRRRYVALQNSQTSFGIGAIHRVPDSGINTFKQEYADPNGFGDIPMCEIPNRLSTFTSPLNSSSSTFNTPQAGNVDIISSVVSMLKGTLERKKLSNQIEKEAVEDSSFGYYGSDELLGNTGLNQGQGSHVTWAGAEGSFGIELEGIAACTNPNQMVTLTREPSQSESSTAAPVISTGFDGCDGPGTSQARSICESSRNHVGRSSENGPRAKGVKESIYDNLKEDKKKEDVVRYASVTSAGSVEQGDPTKKRRVERSRKMAEAKERSLTPAVLSDMQSTLKRCENLEKEVRSLKLNLSFMNRKDSEQTKQIEELRKQNDGLSKEKERLLEEIERIIAETGKV